MHRIWVFVGLTWLTAASALAADLTGTVQASDTPLANAVVWLEVADAPIVSQSSRVVLDQRNLTFSPQVLAVQVGTTVDFPNNDTVFHNVFSFRNGKRFDLGMYPTGTSKHIMFDKPGLARVFCNIHPNMAAYVLAVDTPYYAVSDGRGTFTITGVPPGTYTYHAWRPGSETLTGSVSVGDAQRLRIQW